MVMEALLHVPAFNINKNVRNFMLLGEVGINRFDADQAALYTGLQLEEMGEKIRAVMAGCITPSSKQELGILVAALEAGAEAFKAGHHTGDVLRGDRVEMLDADIDLAWVALGGAYSTSNNVDGACAAVAEANLAKIPETGVVKNAHGKIVKPAGWTKPDLSSYIDPVV